MKIDRLISIIMVLLERKRVSATKLAEMFEVTPRTIYRDIDAINLAGIPIITYPGANGGIGIMEEYKVDKKLFTTSDITTLLIGLASIPSELSSEEIVNTLAKVKGLIPTEQIHDIEFKSNQITVDITPWAGNKNIQPNIEEIKKALDGRRFISFEYSDRVGNRSRRKVEPYQLVLKEAKWYLQAFCTEREDFRVFKISRIFGLEIMDETFSPREFQARALKSPEWVEKKIIKVKLLVDESLRERMIELCGEENVVDHGEGKLMVDFPFMEDDYGYNMILNFGDKCECLEPENVRCEVIRRIKRMSDIYA